MTREREGGWGRGDKRERGWVGGLTREREGGWGSVDKRERERERVGEG